MNYYYFASTEDYIAWSDDQMEITYETTPIVIQNGRSAEIHLIVTDCVNPATAILKLHNAAMIFAADHGFRNNISYYSKHMVSDYMLGEYGSESYADGTLIHASHCIIPSNYSWTIENLDENVWHCHLDIEDIYRRHLQKGE